MFTLVPQLPTLTVDILEIDTEFYEAEQLLMAYPEQFPQFTRNFDVFPETGFGFKTESYISSLEVTHGNPEKLEVFEYRSYLVTSSNGKFALLHRGSSIADSILDDVPFQLLVPNQSVRAGAGL